MKKVSSPYVEGYRIWVELSLPEDKVKWDDYKNERITGHEWRIIIAWQSNSDHSYGFSTPDMPEFTYFLDELAGYNPETYRAIYEHIETLGNPKELLSLAKHCKRMSNKLVNDYISRVKIPYRKRMR